MNLIEKIDKMLLDSTVVGGSYIGGTTTSIVGSQQTRTGAEETNPIVTMQQKEPFNKKPVKFSTLLGGYVPKDKAPDEETLFWSMRV